MTSIPATSNTTHQSPLQRLQDELKSEIASGDISSSDRTALSSALSDINSALQSSASDQASDTNTKTAPHDLQSKISSLIAGEVSSGKLTNDQATELQGLFKAAFANGRGGTSGSPPTDGASPTASTGDSSTPSSNSLSSQSAEDIMKELQKLVQNSLSLPSTSYNATGSGANSSSLAASLINYQS
jgi:hypothetical protein